MSMLRSVLTYMGLGPDEDYDDGYLYEADRRSSATRPGRLDEPEDEAIDLRDGSDPHAQRTRPDWMEEPEDGGVDSAEVVFDEVPTGPIAGAPVADPLDLIDEEPPSKRGRHDADPSPDVRPLRAVPSEPDALLADDGVKVRSVSKHGDDRQGSAVDPRSVKATILAPRSFGDAKILADEFKSSVPLVMNLQEVDRELARRLIDFASGICYALEGGMEKIAPQVFLLIPDEAEVSDAERRRLEQLGFGR